MAFSQIIISIFQMLIQANLHYDVNAFIIELFIQKQNEQIFLMLALLLVPPFATGPLRQRPS